MRVLGGVDAESSASLHTGAELNLGDRVLGEAEEDHFITLPDRGDHSGLMPSKPCAVGSFTVIVQRGHDQLMDILLMG